MIADNRETVDELGVTIDDGETEDKLYVVSAKADRFALLRNEEPCSTEAPFALPLCVFAIYTDYLQPSISNIKY